MDIVEKTEPIEHQRERGGMKMIFGYDEISEAHILMISNPGMDTGE